MSNPIGAPLEYANLDKAQAEGRALWAMEMHDGFPVKAHRITAIEYAPDGRRISSLRPVTYLTACHRRMDPSLTGCWETTGASLPLQDHAIHCDDGWTVSGPSGLPGSVASDTPERRDLTG